jgi:hypothetical protein
VFGSFLGSSLQRNYYVDRELQFSLGLGLQDCPQYVVEKNDESLMSLTLVIPKNSMSNTLVSLHDSLILLSQTRAFIEDEPESSVLRDSSFLYLSSWAFW